MEWFEWEFFGTEAERLAEAEARAARLAAKQFAREEAARDAE